jgi:hypothetical protein
MCSDPRWPRRYPGRVLATDVCAALADPSRLRIFGEICRLPAGVRTANLALDGRDRKALERLLRMGLVERVGDRYVARPEVFRQALTSEASTRPDGASERVAALFRQGRLTTMPRPGDLRTELLRYLARRFDRDRAYSEQEIRDMIAPVWDDHAAIRRYFVDEGIMDRDQQGLAYWRPD